MGRPKKNPGKLFDINDDLESIDPDPENKKEVSEVKKVAPLVKQNRSVIITPELKAKIERIRKNKAEKLKSK